MRLRHSLIAVALVLVLASGAYAGDGKGKKNQAVNGVVTAVEKDKDTGTITVKVQPKAKKGATEAPPAEEKKFKVTATTKFEQIGGKKGALQATTATFDDVKAGVPVVISHTGDVATQVTIQQGKKAK